MSVPLEPRCPLASATDPLDPTIRENFSFIPTPELALSAKVIATIGWMDKSSRRV
jgi:hypothetical protein